MHPILLQLGRLQIRSYGFMLAVSFLLGIWLASRRAKRYGVDPQKILDLSVIIILAAVVGSRLLYVVFHLDRCSNPLGCCAVWKTHLWGLNDNGVLVGEAPRPFVPSPYDVMAPSIALGRAAHRCS
jgi:phosphatidylglycerol:prolipoprotein diacylglycerol transferase